MPDSDSRETNSSLPPHLDDFFAECDEHLAAARQSLLALEPLADKPQIDRPSLEELFRAFHSIKGLSAMVGVRAAEVLAHQMESYLGAMRLGRVHIDPPGFNALVEGVSQLEAILEAYRNHVPPPDTSHVVQALEALVPAENAAATAPKVPASSATANDRLNPQQQERVASALRAGKSAWWITFKPSPELAERKINVDTVRAQLKSIGELVLAAPQVLADGKIAFVFLVLSQTADVDFADRDADGLSFAPYLASPSARIDPAVDVHREVVQPAATAQPPSPTNVVRVDLGRLDDLMRLVGDLVITRARFEQNLGVALAHLPPVEGRALQENNKAFERQIRDLREGIMRARLVPIRDTFSRMQFIARDLTRELEKDVRVQLVGGETEVDKFIVERAMDPLLHLVRNAVSHGIESAVERTSAGKPRAGVVTLRARTDGQTIIIEVEDDGRGINRQEIFARAQRLGLLPSGGGLDDADILDILCEPGFSTRDDVDRASGRGVGMNVVKSTVEGLGGRLWLRTESGQGTCFSMQLPLTLSITDALVFEVGGQAFALPQAAVQVVFEFDSEETSSLESHEVVYHRGAAVPLLRLAALFGLTPAPAAVSYAVMIGDGRNTTGLVVDRLVGLHEIVARPLTDPLVRAPGIAGVTELGDGRVVLILDALGAMQAAGERKLFAAKATRSRAAPLMGASHGRR